MSEDDSKREERLDEIKKELAKELAKKKVNFGRISELATDLSGLDSESAAFSVNATIIRRIGRELVAAHETALAELVKNAYDADAQRAKVTFSRTGKAGGRLVIEDDGVGMTPEQVRDGFLRIASPHKEEEPVSTRYRRKRAGQKGIGRFAVERLGERLHLVTATADDPLATELLVEWADFEKTAQLASIRSPIKRTPKDFHEGTKLIIDGLREAWSIEDIQTAESYVSDLTEPKYFSGHLPVIPSTGKASKDPGFSPIFSVVDGVLPKPVPAAEAEAVNTATAFVDAVVDEAGEWKLHIKAAAEKIDRTFALKDVAKDSRHEWKFDALRSVRLRAAYFAIERDADLPEGPSRVKVRRILRARGGIKLYRNGFRVAPYGSPGNDWLGLDRVETKRELLVQIKNINWAGFVSIDDPNNNRAVETSSREGLVENEFFDELIRFVVNCLTWTAVEIGTARGRKVYARGGGREFGQAKSERALRAARTVSKYLDELQKTRRSSASGYAKDAITDSTLDDIRSELEKMVKDSSELVGEVGILRVFASVGMSVLMFSHEVKGLLASMLGQVDELVEDSNLSAPTKRHLKEFRHSLDRLQHLTNFYESTGSAAADRQVSGVGIKPADKDKVFEPFYTTTPVKRALRPGDPEMFGTGLGLTIARDAVRAARGSVEVVLARSAQQSSTAAYLPTLRYDSGASPCWTIWKKPPARLPGSRSRLLKGSLC
jgi:signal transduction histidine kinase